MKTDIFVPCCTPITEEGYSKMLPFLERAGIEIYEKQINISNESNSNLSNVDLYGSKRFIETRKGLPNCEKVVSNFQFLINSGAELTLQDVYIEVNDENRSEVIEFVNETYPNDMVTSDNIVINDDNCRIYFKLNGWFYYYYYESGLIQTTIEEVKEYFGNKEDLTLKNIQVDCRGLSEEQIKEMADVFEKNGYKVWDDDNALTVDEFNYLLDFDYGDVFVSEGSENKTTITYDEFMELFGKPNLDNESDPKVFNPQPHYDNTNGSLYKIGTERNWNPYIFDIVKRLERGGKKDPLKQEIEKSIDVLKIWLNELGE